MSTLLTPISYEQECREARIAQAGCQAVTVTTPFDRPAPNLTVQPAQQPVHSVQPLISTLNTTPADDYVVVKYIVNGPETCAGTQEGATHLQGVVLVFPDGSVQVASEGVRELLESLGTLHRVYCDAAFARGIERQHLLPSSACDDVKAMGGLFGQDFVPADTPLVFGMPAPRCTTRTIPQAQVDTAVNRARQIWLSFGNFVHSLVGVRLSDYYRDVEQPIIDVMSFGSRFEGRGDPPAMVFNYRQTRRVVGIAFPELDLRVIVQLSGDQRLLGAFENPEFDLRRYAAAVVLEKEVNAVTEVERFNIGTAVVLALQQRQMGIGTEENSSLECKAADYLVAQFYRQHAGVFEWRHRVKYHARHDGYVTTIYGRRYRVPEANPRDPCEPMRQALNMVVRGSAADIRKVFGARLNNRMQVSWADQLLAVGDSFLISTFIEGSAEFEDSSKRF